MEKLLSRNEKRILEMLDEAGFEGFFVGGCVRDSFLGKKIGDVDVATNARPDQIKEVFSSYHVIETGIKHGTVTVVMDGLEPVEITTYRAEGKYSDSRHPDNVEFVTSIEEDLSRRDFTVNAIACNKKGEIVDPFDGQADLKRKIIRAVGDAEQRFNEDALRIMRGLRFAAQLGFSVEEKTEKAMYDSKHQLHEISAERIFAEFRKLIMGDFGGKVIRKHVDVLGIVMPELSAMKGFRQHNPYHKYDVLEHCVRAMEEVETTEENRFYMRMAALFHDVGKPEVFTMDEDGIGHFYGHPARSEELVNKILTRFKADKFTLKRICVLVKYHDLLFREDKSLLKKWMNRLTPEILREILLIKWADNVATGNMGEDLSERFANIRVMMDEILREQQCFSLKDLAVNGSDLIEAGIKPGPEMGKVLNQLLEAVVDERCPNIREALFAWLKKM